jgi:V8-like Glu-specific endopeptidase
MKALILFLTLSLGLPTWAAIYGENSIKPITLGSKSRAGRLARSVAVAVLSANIEESAPGFLRLLPDTAPALCKGEALSSEPSLYYACSGFLVGPDLIATAGHCMVNTGEDRNETETYCEAFSWLFDYQVDAHGKLETERIPEERHYKCKQVIYAISESEFPYRDFALVQLDRPVKDRKPFKLSAKKQPWWMPLSTIGFPLGTPAKFSTGAHILINNDSRPSFITNLDGFEGNSGSVVVNSKDEAVGIFIGGVPAGSTVEDKVNSCERLNRCDDKGQNCLDPEKPTDYPNFQGYGTEVTRIQYIIDLINE